MSDAEEAAERVDDRVDEARDVYERQGKILRFVWIVVAFLVVIGGLAMIVIPGGPATVVVPVGLGMLAVVFGWARHLLMRSVRKGVEAKKFLEDTNTKVKLFGYAALGCLNAAVLALIVVWLVF
ncbi:MAG: PGPGW domain-containing protein [Actinomycetota bacterium]|nr:PGPGW domain-containing protein [Actinomycetota bacterium]